MKRKVSVLLIFILLISTTVNSYAIEPPKSTILKTVSSGLNYYIEFQFNGQTYRSDEVGEAINRNLWKYLEDEDKMKVAKVYGFSPNSRIDQFGIEGSKEITSFVNYVQGWTEAAEIFQDRIAKREFPELTKFYTEGLWANEQEFINNYHPYLLSESTKAMVDYKNLTESYKKIEVLYNIGSDAYQKLVRFKTMQIGNAIKGGSKPLIELIVSNSFLPVVGATAVARFTGPAIDGLGLLYDQLKGIYDNYNYDETQDVGKILDDLWEVIDKLEEIADSCKIEIQNEMALLKSNYANLELHSNNNKEKEENSYNKKKQIMETEVKDNSYYYDYGIDTSEENYMDIVMQYKSELDIDLQNFVERLNEKERELYLSFDPNYSGNFNIFEKLIFDTEGLVIPYIYDYSSLDPVETYNGGYGVDFTLEQIDHQIDNSQNSLIEQFQKKKEFLSLFSQKADYLWTSEISKWNSLKGRANGLDEYIDIDLNQPTSEILKISEIQTIGGKTFEDYQQQLIDEMELMENVVGYFKEVTSDIKSNVNTKVSEYESLKSNLENSIIYYINTVKDLLNLYNNNQYFEETTLDSLPGFIDDFKVWDIISQLPEENKEAKAREIITNLTNLRKKELDILRKIQIGKNNILHDKKVFEEKINGIIGENSNYSAKKEILSSYDIFNSFNDLDKYLGRYYEKEYGPSNVNHIIEKLRLRTPFYYQILMLTEELQDERQNLMNLPKEEFDRIHTAYYYRHEALQNLGLRNAMYEKQKDEIYLGGHPFSKLLEEIRAKYYNFPDFIVKADKVRIIDRDRGHYLDSTGLDLQIGNTLNLGAYIQPATADNKSVTWKSSNPAVVSIDKNGTIIANGKGSAVITVTTIDGGKASNCKVMVEDNYQNYNDWRDKPIGVESQKSWRVRLSQPIDPGSVNNDNVYILDKYETKLDYIIAIVEEDEIGQYILLLNTKGFIEGESYTLVITPKVKSQSGEYLREGIKMKW